MVRVCISDQRCEPPRLRSRYRRGDPLREPALASADSSLAPQRNSAGLKVTRATCTGPEQNAFWVKVVETRQLCHYCRHAHAESTATETRLPQGEKGCQTHLCCGFSSLECDGTRHVVVQYDRSVCGNCGLGRRGLCHPEPWHSPGSYVGCAAMVSSNLSIVAVTYSRPRHAPSRACPSVSARREVADAGQSERV